MNTLHLMKNQTLTEEAECGLQQNVSSPPPNIVTTSTPTKYEELNEISYLKQAVIDETKDDVLEENKGEDIHIDLNESVVETTEFSKVVSKHPLAVRPTNLKSSSNKPTNRRHFGMFAAVSSSKENC